MLAATQGGGHGEIRDCNTQHCDGGQGCRAATSVAGQQSGPEDSKIDGVAGEPKAHRTLVVGMGEGDEAGQKLAGAEGRMKSPAAA